MKSHIYLCSLMAALATQSGLLAAATDCHNPCGPLQILECAGKLNNRHQTAEEAYNSLIFGTNTADKFCRTKHTEAVITPLQNLYFDGFCSQPSPGAKNYPYSSYNNFLAAYTEMQAKLPNFGSFACIGDKSLDNKEMANFFSTITQETTGQITKNNDGVYYRYENQSLVKCYMDWKYDAGRWLPVLASEYQCKDLDSKTGYWGDARLNVIMVNRSTKAVYTKAYWNNANISDGKVTGNKVDLTQSPIVWSWNDNTPVPDPGYEFVYLTDAMNAGYIIGMGQIQLTGSSMMEFFGWYYNHLAPVSQNEADLNGFIQRFLVDGQLAMEGSFFYWMYRTNGSGRPTLHQVLAGTGTVCHDAAIASRVVNGGCNDYQSSVDAQGALHPGRIGYYQYFLETVFGQTEQRVTYPYNGILLDNFVCDYPSQPAALETYCYTTVAK